MPQAAFSPTLPVSAAQRAGTWSVPRMRQVLSVTSTASPTGQPVTLSLGIAHYPSSHGQIEAVLRSADQALYLAKNQGRNRVVVAQPAP